MAAPRNNLEGALQLIQEINQSRKFIKDAAEAPIFIARAHYIIPNPSGIRKKKVNEFRLNDALELYRVQWNWKTQNAYGIRFENDKAQFDFESMARRMFQSEGLGHMNSDQIEKALKEKEIELSKQLKSVKNFFDASVLVPLQDLSQKLTDLAATKDPEQRKINKDHIGQQKNILDKLCNVVDLILNNEKQPEERLQGVIDLYNALPAARDRNNQAMFFSDKGKVHNLIAALENFFSNDMLQRINSINYAIPPGGARLGG